MADAVLDIEEAFEVAILIDPDSGLITIVGGKWTTYRETAEDVVDQAAVLAELPASSCATESLPIHGHTMDAGQHGRLAYYGSDVTQVRALINADSGATVRPGLTLTRAEIVWSCRNEMAKTVDNILARRSRSFLFDARASSEAAEAVAEIVSEELGRDVDWTSQQVEEFRTLARSYTV